ncbi:hypothetical protein [Shahe hepe-like virus 2]|uniref:hypothetical protein n=1 Tax=Shahe hepe-like virus 2 TaxID=1923416 RepID=UPI00090B36EA|nr:hypothetical protein [Shahe hepe-like virus 2]APG77717.1 hypothetical protein [Shahe hepe-like virus 2]
MNFDLIEDVVGDVMNIYPEQPIHARAMIKRHFTLEKLGDHAAGKYWLIPITFQEPDQHAEYMMYRISNYKLEFNNTKHQMNVSTTASNNNDGYFRIAWIRDPMIGTPKDYMNFVTRLPGSKLVSWYDNLSFQVETNGWRYCKKGKDKRLTDYGDIIIAKFSYTGLDGVWTESFDIEYSVPTLPSKWTPITCYALDTLAAAGAADYKDLLSFTASYSGAQQLYCNFKLGLEKGAIPTQKKGRITLGKPVVIALIFTATPVSGDPYDVTYEFPFTSAECESIGTGLWGGNLDASLLDIEFYINPYGELGADVLSLKSVYWDQDPNISADERMSLKAQLIFAEEVPDSINDLIETLNIGAGSAYEDLVNKY